MGGSYSELHRLNLILKLGEQCNLNEMVCGLIIHQKKTFTLISIWVKESNLSQKDRLD